VAKRVLALVKRELLVWARKSAGLSIEEAAKKVQVKPEKLAAWESGEARPSIQQLRKLGRAYRRPLAVFYLPEPPADFQAMHDFRRLPGEVAGIESPELRLEIRKARYRRQVALDLYRSLGEDPPVFTLTASLTEDPETVAGRARATLNGALPQHEWKTAYQALNGWRSAAERIGVLVFQAVDVAVDEMRGFSVAELPLPAVVVNIKDSPRARAFSLAHELAHLMLREEGLCDLAEDAPRPAPEQRVEVFCNHVAGALLVPAEELLREQVVRQHPRSPVWSDEELMALVNRFQASRETILRRLLLLERTTEAFYRQKRREFLEAYKEQQKEKEREGGFAPPDRVALASAGPLFARLVLDSFHQEKITSSDVSEYLDVRLKWMDKIEHAVFGSRAVGAGR
jgi:Zn-dependent peptidase ImmA (M78 family)/transcriptional regulator with XRE-family HTH domain